MIDDEEDLLDTALGCLAMVFLVLLLIMATLVLVDIFT